ncbi:MAG: hypothetical protein IH935_07450 [Acidobacteria bacterium]|nr:hypothetical protein [Acidobacteriota bacterium]
MAKTTFLNNHSDLIFGYEVDTTVASAEAILTPGDPEADPPVPPEQIGTKVYPASIGTIAFSMLLEIGGVGQVVVTDVDSDGGGDFFTYSELAIPGTGASIRTPWNPSGTLLFTRENNSVSLTYFIPVEHDLFFRTQKTNDSGSIQVKLDGMSIGSFDLNNPASVLTSVVLQEDVASGIHTVEVTADISPPDVFVYFDGFAMLEHNVATGGEFLYRGPQGEMDDSSNNFTGQWTNGPDFASTTDTTASVFFYPQLDTDGKVRFRTQKTADSGIIALYVNGQFKQNIDLYADPAVTPFEITLLDNEAPANDPTGLYEIELRHTGSKNAASAGFFFYFRSAVVVFSRTDTQALQLAADYLKQVAAIRGDGAILDARDSDIVNFDANALYACMGLLAAYQSLSIQAYLDAVKNFLNWFVGRQVSDPGNSFNDGAWNIGYQVNLSPPPTYIPALGPFAQQGISEIKWVDAVQCLPAFVLWWYWSLSGDTATKDALLPKFRKAVDGFIANNYDPQTGFYFSSWQNKTSPTIFLYHDAIRRYNSGGTLLEQHNDSQEGFFTYVGSWSSYAPQGAVSNDEHFTLVSQDYVEFSFALNSGDEVRWVTQTAWDTGLADILVSTDGSNFSSAGTVDGYTATLLLQQEFLIYTAPSTATYWFRIRHSGTINAAGNIAPGWQRLASRFTAGQTDVALGLTGLWMLTRSAKYAHLAARIIRRFPGKFWSPAEGRWSISLDGPAPGTLNDTWYPMAHGYTAFGQKQSRLFQPAIRLSEGLQALEPFQDSEGGFQPPGYIEAEHIFSAFYALGENQLATKTNQAAFDLAKEHIKAGQYLLDMGGVQAGGVVFSKRFQFLYTNISGFACMALAGTTNPFTEQLRFSVPRVAKPAA